MINIAALTDEHIVQILHQSTGLPVSLYERGQCLLSSPAEIACAATMLTGEDALASIQISRSQPQIAQHVISRYGERFLYFELDEERALLVGAFLATPMAGGEIYQLMRQLRLPVSDHEKLLQYFGSLPLADDTRHFYLGQLLRLLFEKRPKIPQKEPTDTSKQLGYDLFQRTYQERSDLFHHPPFFLEELMVTSITAGNHSSAKRAMEEINTLRRAVLADTPLRSLKNSIICSCTLFTRAAIAGGAPSQRAFTLSDTYIQKLELETDMGALARMEEEILLAFVDLVAAQRREQYSHVTRAAINFIDSYLSEKISLKDIARALFIHPSYLSQRFHQDTGQPLSTYVQQRRVEEAKHFLRHTDSNVSEIAHFYQFSSQSHFIQVFKKHTGITPLAYRREFAE